MHSFLRVITRGKRPPRLTPPTTTTPSPSPRVRLVERSVLLTLRANGPHLKDEQP
jgi:hypothetical protein